MECMPLLSASTLKGAPQQGSLGGSWCTVTCLCPCALLVQAVAVYIKPPVNWEKRFYYSCAKFKCGTKCVATSMASDRNKLKVDKREQPGLASGKGV